MNEIILANMILTLTQLFGAYLRYLPFSRSLSNAQKSDLLNFFSLWSVAGLMLNLCIFSDGMNYRTFKLAYAVGWLPYFFISLKIIRRQFSEHIFVLGMQALWNFMMNAFGAMAVALIFGEMSEKFLPIQMSFCLLMLAALLKVERKFFVNLLPITSFFEDKSLRWAISIFPLAIFLGVLIQIFDVTFLTTWRERFSRLLFPIFFMLIYRALSFATRQTKAKQAHEEKNRLLRQQTDAVAENNELMQKNLEEVATLRKNLYETYLTLDDLLAEKKISEAMKFIRQQTKLLDTTAVKIFCESPLINAALSMYFQRAEAAGIRFTHKTDLPKNFSTDESDLAVLLSNLLENAITASLKQKNPAEREISLVIRNADGQYVLEISNRFAAPIKIGENGLPYTTEIGRGLGMSSLELFAKKYDAFVNFEHQNNIVRFSVYWSDN